MTHEIVYVLEGIGAVHVSEFTSHDSVEGTVHHSKVTKYDNRGAIVSQCISYEDPEAKAAQHTSPDATMPETERPTFDDQASMHVSEISATDSQAFTHVSGIPDSRASMHVSEIKDSRGAAMHVSEITGRGSVASMHVSEITDSRASMHVSELTPTHGWECAPEDLDDAEALSSTAEASSSRTSGAAKSKREQLKRRALRENKTDENFYLSRYRDQKNDRKRQQQEWEDAQHASGRQDAMPAELHRRWPCLTEPQKDKAPRSTPRKYWW